MGGEARAGREAACSSLGVKQLGQRKAYIRRELQWIVVLADNHRHIGAYFALGHRPGHQQIHRTLHGLTQNHAKPEHELRRQTAWRLKARHIQPLDKGRQQCGFFSMSCGGGTS